MMDLDRIVQELFAHNFAKGDYIVETKNPEVVYRIKEMRRTGAEAATRIIVIAGEDTRIFRSTDIRIAEPDEIVRFRKHKEGYHG